MNTQSKVKNFFLISIGAIPAVIFRWKIDDIFIVNTIGCFLIGLFNSLAVDSKYKLIFCIGFCGSLTTFSGWILGVFQLISNGSYIQALFFFLLMVIMGFFAACLGHSLAKKINNLL